MLKGILGFLLFLFFLFILILMLTGGFILKKIREFRKAVQDAADQQAFNYRTETGRRRQQYSSRTQNSQQAQGAQREYQSTTRHTRTETGETIIDNRHQERENKKIFDDSDGEYVDFVEES
jgi:ABC-type multidrug transport system fused ATPase/permease subunit